MREVKPYSWFTPLKVGNQRAILKRTGTAVPGAGCYENGRTVLPERFDTEKDAETKATELATIARIENGGRM